MPNWKKIIVSGSDASLSSAYIEGNLTASAAFLTSASIGHLETIYETASVIYSSGSTKFGDTLDDTHEITGSLLVSSSITSISASIDNLTANDKLQLGGAGSQFFAYNEDTVKVKFANWYSSNDRQYGMGQLWFETWFAAIDNNANPALRDERRIGFYLEEPDAGASDAAGSSGAHPSNARFYVDVDGAYLSGSLNVEQSITGSEISASLIGTASIADLATTASHALTSVTASHALNVPDTASHALTAVTASHTAGTASIANNATSASYSLTGDGVFSGSFSGSFQGDASQLNVNPFPFTGSGEMQGKLTIESFNDYVDDYAESYFAGTALASSGDIALTGSIFGPYQNANSFTGSFLNDTGYIILTEVSESLNFVDDSAAQAGGVPLGGLYRNGSDIKIRIS